MNITLFPFMLKISYLLLVYNKHDDQDDTSPLLQISKTQWCLEKSDGPMFWHSKLSLLANNRLNGLGVLKNFVIDISKKQFHTW